MSPGSFHSTPESSSAIVTSGRPVVIAHAVLAVGLGSKTLAPRTPFSSHGSLLTGTLPGSGVAAYFQSLPPRSFGAGVPGSAWYVVKSFGWKPGPAPYGKSACADAARSAPQTAIPLTTRMIRVRTLLPPRRQDMGPPRDVRRSA